MRKNKVQKKENPQKILIKDKILLISHPLMKKAKRSGDIVSFTWSEPHSDFKYYLEIYREDTKKPISIISVAGENKDISFKKKQLKKLFWRIRAVSRHGNHNTNKKLMLIPLNYLSKNSK